MIINLLFFVNQLLTVVHILPFATSTGTKMFTNRGCTMGRITMKVYSSAFVIGFALFYSLNICNISRNYIGNKNYLPVWCFCYTHTFCSCIKDFYVFEYDFVFLSSCHFAKVQQ